MANSNPKRTEAIATLLRDDILRGHYRPGERLPSERDLASRHTTSRGTVREAFKRLEQLGLAEIRPGGARAAAIQGWSLDVLGPLLDLEPTPDPTLVDQILEIGGMLMSFSAEAAVRKGEAAKLAEIRTLLADIRCDASEPGAGEPIARLFRLLADTADHLVVRLIMNGLREQVREHLCRVCGPDTVSPAELRKIAHELDTAVEQQRAGEAAAVIEKLFALLRDHATRQRVEGDSRQQVSA